MPAWWILSFCMILHPQKARGSFSIAALSWPILAYLVFHVKRTKVPKAVRHFLPRFKWGTPLPQQLSQHTTDKKRVGGEM